MKRRLLSLALALILLLMSAGCSQKKAAGGSFPDDGTYAADVSLSGGSGKASVASPCRVTVSGGKITARIEFSSPHYDYVIIDGNKMLPVNEGGNSVFEIPVPAIDQPLEITADTTAMSTPHEIDYTLTFDAATVRAWEENAAGPAKDTTGAKSSESPDAKEAGAVSAGGKAEPAAENADSAPAIGEIPLTYAHEFGITQNTDGTYDIRIGEDTFHADGTKKKIYLAASSAMDLFFAAGALDAVSSTGTKASDWGNAEIRQKVEDGTITYAGKYSAPDYEYLVSSGCDLAIESTMIYHSPDVKEKLESLGIPVLVERSSYETDPLGRMEWIKLYGVLTGHYEEAAAFFEGKVKEVAALSDSESTGQTVAFFYINSAGQPVVRKPGDYISRMIEMAGGTYFLSDEAGEDSVLSSVNMQMEAFVEAARNADVLIYNSSIDAELHDLDELLDKDAVFADFKAVREGNVWCTGKNMFQDTSSIADVILEMHEIFMGTAGSGEELEFFHKLY